MIGSYQSYQWLLWVGRLYFSDPFSTLGHLDYQLLAGEWIEDEGSLGIFLGASPGHII
jgi:hypothetical protein